MEGDEVSVRNAVIVAASVTQHGQMIAGLMGLTFMHEVICNRRASTSLQRHCFMTLSQIIIPFPAYFPGVNRKLTWAWSSAALTFSEIARSGWSIPTLLSRISEASVVSRSASSYCPCLAHYGDAKRELDWDNAPTGPFPTILCRFDSWLIFEFGRIVLSVPVLICTYNRKRYKRLSHDPYITTSAQNKRVLMITDIASNRWS